MSPPIKPTKKPTQSIDWETYLNTGLMPPSSAPMGKWGDEGGLTRYNMEQDPEHKLRHAELQAARDRASASKVNTSNMADRGEQNEPEPLEPEWSIESYLRSKGLIK